MSIVFGCPPEILPMKSWLYFSNIPRNAWGAPLLGLAKSIYYTYLYVTNFEALIPQLMTRQHTPRLITFSHCANISSRHHAMSRMTEDVFRLSECFFIEKARSKLNYKLCASCWEIRYTVRDKRIIKITWQFNLGSVPTAAVNKLTLDIIGQCIMY